MSRSAPPIGYLPADDHEKESQWPLDQIPCSTSRSCSREYRHSIAVDIARATGVDLFNCLYGHIRPDLDAETQHQCAVTTLAGAAEVVAEVGGTVLVESLARVGNGPYPLRTLQDSLDVAANATDAARHGRVAALFDTYHLGSNGEDLVRSAARHATDIAHCQIADAPGRHEPGTGFLPIAAAIDALYAHGYHGRVADEFQPAQTALYVSWMAALGWR